MKGNLSPEWGRGFLEVLQPCHVGTKAWTFLLSEDPLAYQEVGPNPLLTL